MVLCTFLCKVLNVNMRGRKVGKVTCFAVFLHCRFRWKFKFFWIFLGGVLKVGFGC
jgi:hypothetical protein